MVDVAVIVEVWKQLSMMIV